MKSSFVRKGKAVASAPPLPAGTRLSPHNGSILISSGLSDLDDIMSGGLMVGSLIIVEEDVYSDYNQLLLKYFAAEGVANKQQLHVASISSEEASSEKWVRKLPFVSGSPPVQSASSEAKPVAPVQDVEASPSDGGDIKIAWQYKKYLGSEGSATSSSSIGGPKKSPAWCHSYDMMKHMEASYISQTDISSTSFLTQNSSFSASLTSSTTSTSNASNSSTSQEQNCYKTIYDTLNRMVQANNESLAQGGPIKLSRFALPSIGSVCYASKCLPPQHHHHQHSHGLASQDSHHYHQQQQEHKTQLLSFLRALRGLLRQSFATCMITFPAHLYLSDPKFVQRVRHSADTVVQFNAFSDSADPISPAFAEFDGIFSVLKVPRISSLAPLMPAQPSFTFQFKRKKLAIDKIHLPPDMSILEDKAEQKKASSSGGAESSHSHSHSHSHASSSLLCAPGPPSKNSSLDF